MYSNVLTCRVIYYPKTKISIDINHSPRGFGMRSMIGIISVGWTAGRRILAKWRFTRKISAPAERRYWLNNKRCWSRKISAPEIFFCLFAEWRSPRKFDGFFFHTFNFNWTKGSQRNSFSASIFPIECFGDITKSVVRRTKKRRSTVHPIGLYLRSKDIFRSTQAHSSQ